MFSAVIFVMEESNQGVSNNPFALVCHVAYFETMRRAVFFLFLWEVSFM